MLYIFLHDALQHKYYDSNADQEGRQVIVQCGVGI